MLHMGGVTAGSAVITICGQGLTFAALAIHDSTPNTSSLLPYCIWLITAILTSDVVETFTSEAETFQEFNSKEQVEFCL